MDMDMTMFVPQNPLLVLPPEPKLVVVESEDMPLEQAIMVAVIETEYKDVHHQWHNTSILIHTETGHFLVAEDGSYIYQTNDGFRISAPGPERITR